MEINKKTKKFNRDNSYLIGNQFAKGHKPNKTSFKKGHIPWNKGIKGIHLSPVTEFKKGQKSLRWVLVGTKTIRKDKHGVKRRWIKIAEPNKWEEYARFVWKKHFKKIFKEDVIHHLDGNRLNDKIDNLIALPRKIHPKIHSRWYLKKMSKKEIDFYKNKYKKRYLSP